MRTRLKPKLYIGLRAKTWLTVLLVIVFVMPFAYAGFTNREFEKAYAQDSTQSATLKVEVKYPTLNPDLTEREQNIALIKKIWGHDQAIGLAIAKAESGYRTHATNYNTNGTVDEGVFQINSVHNMPEMQVATANISYAYTLFLKQGTTPWNSSKAGWGD